MHSGAGPAISLPTWCWLLPQNVHFSTSAPIAHRLSDDVTIQMITTSECYRGVVSRLSRAEVQLQNRAKVLAAARAEFAEHGYRDGKVDRIADRANLTRGAVYSNFPGKRALYLTALTELADTSPAASQPRRERGGTDGLSAFASAWLSRRDLGFDVLPDVSELPYAELLGLNAVLLGLSLDRLAPGHLGTKIQAARLAITLLHGASQLGASAPGFVQPLAVARACSELADLELDDPWM